MELLRGSPLAWLFTLVVLAAGAALRLWFIHAHPQIQGDSLVYGDIAANWLTHGIYGHSVGHPSGLTTIRAHPGAPARLPGISGPLFCALRRGKLSRRVVPAGAHRPRHLPAHCRPGERRSAVPAPAGSRCCWRRSVPSPPVTSPPRSPKPSPSSASRWAFAPWRRCWKAPAWCGPPCSFFPGAIAALLRPDGALLAVVLWIALIVYGRHSLGLRLRPPPRHGRRPALAAPLCGLDGTQLAHLPCLSAARAALRQRSRRIQRLPALCAGSEPWLPTSPPPARSTGTATATVSIPAICPRAPSTTPRQYQETQRLLRDYNATTTLTPELDARFAQLAQERIRAHPFRYYVTLPLLRLADMWLRPRVETLNAPPALVAVCPASRGRLGWLSSTAH